MITLSSQEAQIIEMLHACYTNKTPDVGQDHILVELGKPYQRLRYAFSDLDAWKALVAKGARKGTVRLNL